MSRRCSFLNNESLLLLKTVLCLSSAHTFVCHCFICHLSADLTQSFSSNMPQSFVICLNQQSCLKCCRVQCEDVVGMQRNSWRCSLLTTLEAKIESIELSCNPLVWTPWQCYAINLVAVEVLIWLLPFFSICCLLFCWMKMLSVVLLHEWRCCLWILTKDVCIS